MHLYEWATQERVTVVHRRLPDDTWSTALEDSLGHPIQLTKTILLLGRGHTKESSDEHLASEARGKRLISPNANRDSQYVYLTPEDLHCGPHA